MQSLPFSGSSLPASPVAGFEFLAPTAGVPSAQAEANLPLTAEGGFAALLTAHTSPESAPANAEPVTTNDEVFAEEPDAEPFNSSAETETWCAAMWPFLPVAPAPTLPATPPPTLEISLVNRLTPATAEDSELGEFGEIADAATDEVPGNFPASWPANAESARPARAVTLTATATVTATANAQDSRAFVPTVEETPPAVSLAFADTDEVTLPLTTRLEAAPSTEFLTPPSTAQHPPTARPSDQLEAPVVMAPLPAAKFSDAASPSAHRLAGRNEIGEIKILNPFEQTVTSAAQAVGTGIANSDASTMSARRKSSANALPGRDPSVESWAGQPAALFSPTHDVNALAGATAHATASAETPAPTTRSVVQQITTVLEAAQTAGEQQPANVKLDFDFGDAQVRVRIEIRDEIVRAHFETDSAELKHSLHTEWQATAAAEPARFARLADPVFTSENSSTQPGANHAGSGHRESASRQSPEEASPSLGGLLGQPARSATPAPALPSSTTSSVHPLRQLHAFA